MFFVTESLLYIWYDCILKLTLKIRSVMALGKKQSYPQGRLAHAFRA